MDICSSLSKTWLIRNKKEIEKEKKEFQAILDEQGKKEEAEQKKAEVAAGAKRLAELEEKEKELEEKIAELAPGRFPAL